MPQNKCRASINHFTHAFMAALSLKNSKATKAKLIAGFFLGFLTFSGSYNLAVAQQTQLEETAAPQIQQTQFGINLANGKEPIELNADNLEMRDKEGIAIFTGNVAVVQGDRILRTAKLTVYYQKQGQGDTNNTPSTSTGLGSSGIDKMEASGKVLIKSAGQTATGDYGFFDKTKNEMILTGEKVVLLDGNNVATGCKLTAKMDTGKAILESCETLGKKGRVSIILDQSE